MQDPSLSYKRPRLAVSGELSALHAAEEPLFDDTHTDHIAQLERLLGEGLRSFPRRLC